MFDWVRQPQGLRPTATRSVRPVAEELPSVYGCVEPSPMELKKQRFQTLLLTAEQGEQVWPQDDERPSWA